MNGLIQDRPLLISSLIEHAAACHGDTEIVSKLPSGRIARTTYRAARNRAKQLAKALGRLGVAEGACVGTLAWNTHRHFELYYAIAGIGAICHTVNPRLFQDQISYIVEHARDEAMFFDVDFLDIVEKLAPVCPSVKHWVALCGPDEVPATAVVKPLCYETLVAAEDSDFVWPEFDERRASSLCYTSGTTGHPKGVLYSHRSTVLHAIAAPQPDCFNLSARDVILPASSMYHANAWGVVYAATLVGAKLVLPGAKLDGESLVALIRAEGVTASFGVPTIWLGVAQHMERTGQTAPSLERLTIGGAACPLALIKTYGEKHGVEVRQLWGMTETSPLGVVNTPLRKHAGESAAERDERRSKQGRVVYGIELEIVDAEGKKLPHDGMAFGDLLVRGWWVASGYFRQDEGALDAQGWFATGDVATLDADGFMRITDRSKDVIKSGGEWISSIDLENAAVGHPDVAEAAVIGVAHPKWDERPLLIVVPKGGAQPTKASLDEHMRQHVAKWWLPDDVIFVDEIPHTATGKIQKTTLRERYRNHLAGAA